MFYGSDSSLSFYSCKTDNESIELSSINYSLDKSMSSGYREVSLCETSRQFNRPIDIGDCCESYLKDHPSLIFNILEANRHQICNLPRPPCVGEEAHTRRTVQCYEEESDINLVSGMPDNISTTVDLTKSTGRSLLTADSDSSLFLQSSLCKSFVKQKMSWKKIAKKVTQKLKLKQKSY